MRALFLNLLIIALAAACGVAILHGLSKQPHMSAMLAAAGASFVASQLAMVPLLLTRNARQIAVAQAALVATMIHLMVTATAAAVVILGHLPIGQPFSCWLLTFYWLTLITVAVECVRAVKRAAPEVGI